MGDDGLSAGDLRKRYHRGGTSADSELSAAQLRSRYAVPSNAKGACVRARARVGGERGVQRAHLHAD